MILPMKKVCVLVQEHTRQSALLKLRDAGVVHLQLTNTTTESGTSVSVERKNKIDNALVMLSEVKLPKNKVMQTPNANPNQLLESVVEAGALRKEFQDRLIFIHREISRIEAWGNIIPASVQDLSKDLPVFFYDLTPDVFENVPEDVRFIKADKTKSSVKIIVFDKELPAELSPGLSPIQLPEKSIADFYKEIDEITLKMNAVSETLKTLAPSCKVLKKEKEIVEQQIEYENALSGMETVADDAPQNTLAYITGYVPAEDMETIKKCAKENCWALSYDDPEETDEKVPTKLRNSKIANLLNPVTGFLGILPGYREVDITPWFFMFFLLFFGMIFGDAVYGAILLLIAGIGIIKTAKKGVPAGLHLLLLLGIVTTTWGVMNCSWLGLDIEYVPQVLQDISFAPFSTAKTSGALVDQNLQFFCFTLGLIHLTIARVKSIFRVIKSPKVLGELGNLAMIWGMYNVVLFLVVSNDALVVYPLLPISIYLLAGGFFLNFLFGSYETSFGQSILDSAKNFITVVLGVPNIFSDIMSYIRLWAVALAGASIASTVNQMAVPMLGNFLIFVGVLLLTMGHGLNLVLNVLSVLVHGVRLNILEFSGHVGLGWSGIPYKPFAKR